MSDRLTTNTPSTTTRKLTRKQLGEERAFLAARAIGANGVNFTNPYRRMTGVSSNALVAFATGDGPEPAEHDYPGDIDDFRACLNAFEASPRHLRAVMVPVLRKYASHVMDSMARWYPS